MIVDTQITMTITAVVIGATTGGMTDQGTIAAVVNAAEPTTISINTFLTKSPNTSATSKAKSANDKDASGTRNVSARNETDSGAYKTTNDASVTSSEKQ